MDDIDDDDDDTVVGTCLHCNAPPPPRSVSSRGSRSSSANPGGGGMVGTCTSLATTTKSNTDNILTVSSRSGTMPPANRVQVSCDDCRSFICDGCHWCHEFQANHEIRVCDRCDAFYCRACDEMDQCEDCSEVVCNTCSTLMSCKFCGCGLCEDCATACGRCGIVLCARDAKFAVECDTCKMSYCLVCLASGTKDPCVRCGHRPSKRMEQLVHLRLKSIYKAFKQSGASMGPGPGNMGGNTKAEFADRNDSNGGGKYSSALRSLLTDGNSDAKDTFSNFDQSMASEVAAVLQTASNSMADSNGVDYMDRRNRGKRISSHDDFNNGRSSSSRTSNAAAERYFRKTQAEMEAAAAAAEVEAEAAAAALLAELDEELETANTTSKKSKKKKKKKESKLKDTIEQPMFVDSSSSTGTVKPAEKGYDDPIALIKKSPKGGSSKATRVSNDDDSSDEEMNFEQLISRGKGPTKASKKDELDDDVSPPPTPLISESPLPQEAEANSTAQFDKELAVLLSSDDEVGLETFLADLKGVPGLGAARKTARKALKRIKEANEVSVPPPIPVEPVKPPVKSGVISEPQFVKEAKAAAKALAAKQASSGTGASGSAANANMGQIVLIHNPTTHEPLLKVVSRTQSIGGATTKGTGPNAVPVAARAECVMHISPAVVGWVIGKGGSRIRDMMEESGAKVWIDQESMAAKDLRVVYVSGKRSAVDTAVRMVKDLVSKAPAAASVATATGSTPTPAPTSVPPLKTSSVPPSQSATPEPASFAAAIASGATSGTSTPVVLTPPGPTPVKKQPPVTSQGWALPAPAPVLSTSASPPPQEVPQIVRESSPPTSMVDAGGASLFSQMISTEFRCDPRFVALLIGRRGWTVKNIQVESGANLRIDQSVDPPKIIISGNVEDVQKAEQMVRDVLKYPHAREHSEDIMVDNLDRSEQQIPPVAAPPSFATTRQRDIPVSNHKYLEELQLQQESLHKPRNFSSDGGTSLPSMYGQFQQQQQQQQQQNQGSMSSFQDSSAAARMSFILANDHQRQTLPPPYVPNFVDTNPNARGNRQEWGHQNQHPPPARNEYSTPLQQFSSNGHQYNVLSLPNVSQAQQSSQQSNQRLFSVPQPQEQRRFPPQNLQAVLQSHKAPAQAPPTRIHDFMGTSDILNRSSNEWELPPAPAAATTARPLSNNPFGNQSNFSTMSSAAPRQQQNQPVFQSSVATTRPLSNNPFEQTPSHDLTPAGLMSAYNNRKSDDSLMVDNLFAAMGTADSGDDLLSALNSVSLGGVSTSQQTTRSNTWDYKIPGWGEDDVGSNSRLGDYS